LCNSGAARMHRRNTEAFKNTGLFPAAAAPIKLTRLYPQFE
jgi:hypothetical protein